MRRIDYGAWRRRPRYRPGWKNAEIANSALFAAGFFFCMQLELRNRVFFIAATDVMRKWRLAGVCWLMEDNY